MTYIAAGTSYKTTVTTSADVSLASWSKDNIDPGVPIGTMFETYDVSPPPSRTTKPSFSPCTSIPPIPPVEIPNGFRR